MQQASLPKCGQCGSTQLTLLETQPLTGQSGFFADARSGTVFVYRCECGWAFTHTVYQDDPPRQVMGGATSPR